MVYKSFGFIGGGRITRIMLIGFKKAGVLPERIFVTDANEDVLTRLQNGFPEIQVAVNDNQQAALQEIVFIALHPPAMADTLEEIHSSLKPNTIVVSLAPKLSISKIKQLLHGFDRIVRIIPNAPSIINSGYNPLAFSGAFSAIEKDTLSALFRTLGKCPEVDEEKLEAYALITAMGPTYLWFQLYELHKLARLFGLNQAECEQGISAMIGGMVKTMYDSGLSQEEVLDLIPIKPLGEDEEHIRGVYKTKLSALYAKLKT